ncbi:MAG TPA: SPOR domain-containing protein [Bacteroidia bacterium]|nr:SPOR domain-containing protein [Bacteroidia bacterium]
MKILIASLIFFLSGTDLLDAQTPADSLQKGVTADPKLKTLVDKHSQINAKKKDKGYRVQIYFGGDKSKAKDVKVRFLTLFGKEAHAYEIYEVPNFKIRVGNFRTRLDAYAFLKTIKADFPTAFIVESEIEL